MSRLNRQFTKITAICEQTGALVQEFATTKEVAEWTLKFPSISNANVWTRQTYISQATCSKKESLGYLWASTYNTKFIPSSKTRRSNLFNYFPASLLDFQVKQRLSQIVT